MNRATGNGLSDGATADLQWASAGGPAFFFWSIEADKHDPPPALLFLISRAPEPLNQRRVSCPRLAALLVYANLFLCSAFSSFKNSKR